MACRPAASSWSVPNDRRDERLSAAARGCRQSSVDRGLARGAPDDPGLRRVQSHLLLSPAALSLLLVGGVVLEGGIGAGDHRLFLARQSPQRPRILRRGSDHPRRDPPRRGGAVDCAGYRARGLVDPQWTPCRARLRARGSALSVADLSAPPVRRRAAWTANCSISAAAMSRASLCR